MKNKKMVIELLAYFIAGLAIGFIQGLHRYLAIGILLLALMFLIATAISTGGSVDSFNIWYFLAGLAGIILGVELGRLTAQKIMNVRKE
jgi:uncharacterized membrane protein YfcA